MEGIGILSCLIYPDHNISARAFELFFGIPLETIKHVRNGRRNLPAPYWHIIYERELPTYGVGFARDLQDSKQKVKKEPMSEEKPAQQDPPRNTGLLSALQKKLKGG